MKWFAGNGTTKILRKNNGVAAATTKKTTTTIATSGRQKNTKKEEFKPEDKENKRRKQPEQTEEVGMMIPEAPAAGSPVVMLQRIDDLEAELHRFEPHCAFNLNYLITPLNKTFIII